MEATKPLGSLLERLTARLARVEAQLGLSGSPLSSPRASATPAAAAAPVQQEEALAPQIAAYDEYVAQYLAPFTEAADKIGGDAKKLADITERAFQAQRAYLVRASRCKKPATLNPEHLKDLQACMKEVNAMRDNRSEFFNHQSMVNEGIQALGWICVEPAPKPFIESYVGGSDLFGNKIRVQFKTTNPDQIKYVTAFKTLLVELMAYVKAHHTTGVTWNPRGVDVAQYSGAAPAPVAAKAAPAAPAAPAASPAGGINAVFAGIKSIDQSQGHTAGLRKVTKDMQTWRAEYKADGAAPAPAPAPKPKAPTAESKPAPAAAKPAKPPVCEQRNGNWSIENFVGGEPVKVSDLNMKQQVYIYGCQDATIILEGKAKSIVLDGCKKTNLVFDKAVSSVEIVNCKNVRVQCTGTVPSVAIDKTDGCLVYVSWEGRNAQFVTSKSSEMNVAFPTSEAGDDFIEKPIPEQFVHKICADQTISSSVSDLYTH